MAHIKAISLDLWQTLITTNPASGRARAAYLARELGQPLTDQFSQLVRTVSREFDLRSEKSGEDFDCGDRIDELARRVGHPALSEDRRRALVEGCQSCILANHPILIDPDTRAKLKRLRKKGLKLALVSNTGYPEAPAMRIIVAALGLADCFDAMLFSGELRKAKPSPAVFKAVCDALSVEPHELLHIGDSRAADYDGATLFGAHALQFLADEEPIDHERIRTLDEVSAYVSDPEPVKRFPLYELTEVEGIVVDRFGRKFSPEDYSRFKHGDVDALRRYGYKMADLFMWRFGARLRRSPDSFVIAPFAYMHVPTAAGNMMEWFYERLGEHLRSLGLPCVERINIYKRVTSHAEDHRYAKVSLEERRRILADTKLSIDKARLSGKTLVLIDDVYITGSSEAVMRKTVAGSGVHDLVFLYVARMDPAVALADPAVESRLNHHTVMGLAELQEIFVPGRYRMNLRNCKFVLEQPLSAVQEFLRQLDTSVLVDIRQAVHDNSYYLERKYFETCLALETELVGRGAIPPGVVSAASLHDADFSIRDDLHGLEFDHH